jgi:hypothetical protein
MKSKRGLLTSGKNKPGLVTSGTELATKEPRVLIDNERDGVYNERDWKPMQNSTKVC